MSTRGKRVRELRKPRNTKYGQAFLRHARRGVRSIFGAVISLCMIGYIIYQAFTTRGEVPHGFAGFAFMAAIIAILGIRGGVIGFKERDKKYITCKIGIVLNSMALLILGFIFWGGVS